MQLPRLQKDLHTGSISEDIVNFPSELLCRHRSGTVTEVARLVPPDLVGASEALTASLGACGAPEAARRAAWRERPDKRDGARRDADSVRNHFAVSELIYTIYPLVIDSTI